MAEDSHLKRQLVRYRDLLANLSRRNREIYFRESKGSSLNLTRSPFSKSAMDENSETVFMPLRTFDNLFEEVLKGKELDLHDHFQFDDLKDKDSAVKLNKKLDKIRIADDRHQREFGISGAWILGPFLCWRTSTHAPKADLLISPLLKIPVDIRKNKKQKHVLVVEDEHLSINPSLRLCLKQKLGLEIPENTTFASPKEAVEFLTKALAELKKELRVSESNLDGQPKIPAKQKIIKDENGEIAERRPVVLEEELSVEDLAIYDSVTATEFLLIDVVYLDQLNASRTVLINDYESILENPTDHPILNELFNGTSLADEPPVDRSELRKLDDYKERDNHFVVNIDSTQHRAIDKATKSKAIVIQGPPGTGKSQTITNLIAEYLAKGKRVLFVSEKRPALDVVHNRLKSANIESQSVLIHSSDLDKPDLYRSFLQLADSTPSEADARERQNAAETLDRSKSDLNSYADALQAEHLQSHLSVGELLFLASQTDQSLFDPNLKSLFGHLDLDQMNRVLDDIREIQSILSELKDINTSPWLNRLSTTVQSTSLLHDLKSIQGTVEAAREKKKQLKAQIAKLIGEDNVLDLIGKIVAFARGFDGSQPISADFSPVWKELSGDGLSNLDGIQTVIEKQIASLESHLSCYKAIAPGSDVKVIEQLEEYYRLPRGFTDYFSGSFWALRRARLQVCPAWDGTNKQFVGFREYRKAFEGLRLVTGSVQKSIDLQESDFEASKAWSLGAVSNIKKLKSFLVQTKGLTPHLLQQATQSYEAYRQVLSDTAEARGHIVELQDVNTVCETSWSKLHSYLAVVPKLDEPLEDSCRRATHLMERIQDLDTFDKSEILITKASVRNELPNLKTIIFSQLVKSEKNWADAIHSSVMHGWADEIRARYQPLRSFERVQHVARVGDFKAQEEKHKLTSRQAVHHAFAKRWTTSSDRTGLPLLKKESNKQRRVLSPREIMEKGALKTMMQLKPCWLMSPLSISQMLPLQKGMFDVIIFDEASQVRVEDAIPSIYRANTMIVVGDNKQMPPTSFFSGALPDDDEEDEPISDSILDLASAVYPSVLLEWHYRSRAEALIAFSNRAFYGGRLIAAPNPTSLTASGAIKHIEIGNAYFAGKNGNQVEAEAVINHLVDLISKNEKRSYGVIAMGQPQTLALEEALEKRMSNDPRARTLIEAASNYKDGESDAGLFIKNLENVQGDERDVIVMSVGYAPSAPDKKLHMNFGPLSKQGGGRRLNVAITRAKSEMFVFSSFSPSVLSTDEEVFNRNPDLCIFGRYLKYAKAVSDGQTPTALGILNSFGMGGVITSRKSSRFALDVKRRLEEAGYIVTAEIGSSGFFIDLGIHHPVLQSNFILGIECDGAMFHSTPYARDRDKIREELLKSRGWRIERVWSQDWSKDWRKEIIRLELILKRLIEQPEQSPITGKASGE